MKPDFQSMSLQELRQYVLAHREDDTAFQVLAERLHDRSSSPVYGEVSLQEFADLLAQQRSQHNNGN